MKTKTIRLIYFILVSTFFSTHYPSAHAQVIAAGDKHSLFVCNDNTVLALGYNTNGQLGMGTTSYFESNPVQVNNLNNIIAVAAGSAHSLFLKSDGTVWACGSNSSSQLGDGTTTERHSPVMVTGLSDVIKISANNGSHSLFLKSDGTVWACGSNGYGQLGDSTQLNRNTPVQVHGLTSIIDISAGESHSLFVKSDGTVWACGQNNLGQFGNGTTMNSLIAVQIPSLTNISAVATGQFHSLFLKNDGTVRASGHNLSGQLGNGSTTTSNVPLQVSNMTGVVAIDACDSHSHFLKSNGTAWGCGNNSSRTVGVASPTTITTPVQATGLTGVTELQTGFGHTLFAKSNGSVYGCGGNNYGQINTGSSASYTPDTVNGLCIVLGMPIEESESINYLEVFPNPATGEINIKTAQSNIQSIDIYDMTGRCMFAQPRKMTVIDVSTWDAGVYFLNAHVDGNILVKKFIVNK